MTEAVFQHVRVSGKKFERSSVVLDNMWFENWVPWPPLLSWRLQKPAVCVHNQSGCMDSYLSTVCQLCAQKQGHLEHHPLASAAIT
jgi:hypothetical protein